MLKGVENINFQCLFMYQGLYKNKSLKKGQKIGLGITVMLFTIYFVWTSYEINQLKNNFSVGVGTITKISDVFRSTNWCVLYEYDVNGEKFNGEGIYSFCGDLTFSKLESYLNNKSFPVAFAKNNVGNSRIIITQKDADEFNYTIADSLLRYDSLLNCR